MTKKEDERHGADEISSMNRKIGTTQVKDDDANQDKDDDI